MVLADALGECMQSTRHQLMHNSQCPVSSTLESRSVALLPYPAVGGMELGRASGGSVPGGIRIQESGPLGPGSLWTP